MIESVIVVIREVTQQNEKRNLACRQSLRDFYKTIVLCKIKKKTRRGCL